MSPEEQPAGATGAAEAVTPGGYSYTVEDDEASEAAEPPRRRVRMRVPRGAWLAAAIVVPAVAVGLLVWALVPSGGSSDTKQTSADVGNILAAFGQGQAGIVSKRYEGQMAPGFPDGVPSYPGARLLTSVLQLRGADAAYLVVYDTSDDRDKVASYLGDKFREDPWQVDRGSDDRESTVRQFSRIDDANLTGVVLVTDSTTHTRTTIVESLQIAAGAKDRDPGAFEQPPAQSLPAGYPGDVPAYAGALLIESAFQKQGGATSFAASYVTKDPARDVLDFYRDRLKSVNLTVADGDASQSALPNAQEITFTDTAQQLGGSVTAGEFAEDKNYTRIDLQVQVSKAP